MYSASAQRYRSNKHNENLCTCKVVSQCGVIVSCSCFRGTSAQRTAILEATALPEGRLRMPPRGGGDPRGVVAGAQAALEGGRPGQPPTHAMGQKGGAVRPHGVSALEGHLGPERIGRGFVLGKFFARHVVVGRRLAHLIDALHVGFGDVRLGGGKALGLAEGRSGTLRLADMNPGCVCGRPAVRHARGNGRVLSINLYV